MNEKYRKLARMNRFWKLVYYSLKFDRYTYYIFTPIFHRKNKLSSSYYTTLIFIPGVIKLLAHIR